MTMRKYCRFCKGKLLWETFSGMRLYRTVKGKRVYRVKCSECNYTDEVTRGGGH